MSIVGPRPERPFYVEQFKAGIPGYTYRHNVKPGITGLAQVYGKYNTTPYDKLIFDLIYIQKSSVIFDLIIMFQTVGVLVTKESTAGISENNMEVDIAKYSVIK
jgi:lipopolysaccharide/colanic/teichoic acid biosynthesis glycosyltransferase